VKLNFNIFTQSERDDQNLCSFLYNKGARRDISFRELLTLPKLHKKIAKDQKKERERTGFPLLMSSFIFGCRPEHWYFTIRCDHKSELIIMQQMFDVTARSVLLSNGIPEMTNFWNKLKTLTTPSAIPRIPMTITSTPINAPPRRLRVFRPQPVTNEINGLSIQPRLGNIAPGIVYAPYVPVTVQRVNP